MGSESVIVTGVGDDSGNNFIWGENSPAVNYVDLDSPLTFLKRFVLPDKRSTVPLDDPTCTQNCFYSKKPVEKYPYITDHRIAQLNSLGITTIREFAEAD